MAAFNMDESPVNRDHARTKWNIPPYKSKAFYRWLEKKGLTLSSFRQTGRYRAALKDGKIVKDKWVGGTKS